jgi:hypothetical protein
MSSIARLELFVTMSRMGISGHMRRIEAASLRGMSKSRLAMMMARSNRPSRNKSRADSSVYAQVTRGMVFRLSLKYSPYICSVSTPSDSTTKES